MAKKEADTSNPRPTVSVEEPDLDVNAEVQSATEQVAAAREQLRAAEAQLEQAREKAAKPVTWVGDKNAGELIDATLDFVRKHPGVGVLTAASLGFLFARLFRR
jgi:ElaB/YqjD/DUF883 family membrane-anchored ribosome-binding protein